MAHIDSNRIRFIPPEERWEPEFTDNVHREGRNEYYVTTIVRVCPECEETVERDCECDGRNRPDLSSMRITRNFETRRFILYVDGESVIEAEWANTPSGQGPNGHKKVLKKVKMFAKGWMVAEEEVPVNNIHLHSEGRTYD